MKALLALFCAFAAHGQDLVPLLSRLSSEAENFRRLAPQTLAEETLEQRVVLPSRTSGPAAFHTREIVSEYTIGHLESSHGSLHEFRQVIRVDGRAVRKPEKARHTLSLGMTSPDDRSRKRMLEDFQAYGLTGAAVDFGPLILLFTREQIRNYIFTAAGTARLGADEVLVLSYKQAGGGANLTVFSGRNTVRQPLEGRVLLRKTDGLPIRITLSAARTENGRPYVEQAAVDYIPTTYGSIAPAAVLHRSLAGSELVTEHRFRYSAFKKFGAETEIKFTEIP
ncbi:MAG TPA: hypothetical protein VN442_11315 [Bryobacteraceae bacterium]|nr:hypothetical protein [Bryobacteraceae bacterium]